MPQARRSSKKPAFNRKLAQPAPGGGFKLRAWQTRSKPPKGGRPGAMGRFRIKCGCCDESVLIAYDDQSLEINGVMASTAEWRLLLEPLLAGKEPRPRK